LLDVKETNEVNVLSNHMQFLELLEEHENA